MSWLSTRYCAKKMGVYHPAMKVYLRDVYDHTPNY